MVKLLGGIKNKIITSGSLALAGITWPNKSVKGTHRPLAVLKFRFYPAKLTVHFILFLSSPLFIILIRQFRNLFQS